ncbi:protein NATD1 isoform X1 [Mirounga angustirostris]|uniref:protein NATD1 isoform X1 n=1 Tax=Mirounga angustirostris TaxID=9716 RepID=UPI00313B4264
MAHSAAAVPLGALEQGCPIRVEHDRRRRQFTVRLNGVREAALGRCQLKKDLKEARKEELQREERSKRKKQQEQRACAAWMSRPGCPALRVCGQADRGPTAHRGPRRLPRPWHRQAPG